MNNKLAAKKQAQKVDATTFAESWVEANGLCTQILNHSVTPESIAA